MTSSPFFGLQYLSANQSQKEVYVNSDLAIIDSFLQLVVIDTTLSTPPSSPSDQDKYIVPVGANGVWSGHSQKIAVYQSNGSTWTYVTPYRGWTVYSIANSAQYTYNGSTWSTTNTSTVTAKSSTSIAYTDRTGIIHQYGITGPIGTSSSAAITLPIALTTAAVGIVVTPMVQVGTSFYATCTTTTLTIHNGAAANQFSWNVTGY